MVVVSRKKRAVALSLLVLIAGVMGYRYHAASREKAKKIELCRQESAKLISSTVSLEQEFLSLVSEFKKNYKTPREKSSRESVAQTATRLYGFVQSHRAFAQLSPVCYMSFGRVKTSIESMRYAAEWFDRKRPINELDAVIKNLELSNKTLPGDIGLIDSCCSYNY